MQEMKILVLVWNYYPDTAYTNRTRSTVRGLQENGAKVDILSIKPTTLEESSLLNRHFKTNGNGIKGMLGALYAVATLIATLQRYDIIYCTVTDSRLLRLVHRLAVLSGKVVVHERTEAPDIFFSNTPKGKRAFLKYCKIVNKFNHCFVISSAIKNFFEEHGMDKRRISIYPMTIDPNRFKDISRQPDALPSLVYCGNMQNSKDGLSNLIEAFGASKSAKNVFDLVLYGKLPGRAEMDVYREQIRRLGVADKVKFMGNIPMSKMPQALANAHGLVLCRPQSRQAECGFPTKLGEYLATGHPVVVTNVGDIGHYIKDGVNGYIVEPNDILSFAERMDKIASDPKTADELGARGKELTLKEFNYKVQTENILEVLSGLIQNKI